MGVRLEQRYSYSS